MGLMKSTRTKVVRNQKFLLSIPDSFRPLEVTKKVLLGEVVCLNIVSSSGTGFVKARFGQVGD